jgi:ATP-binding cassette subfamily B protein
MTIGSLTDKSAIIARTWKLLYKHQGHRILWAIGVAATGVYATTSAWLSKQVIDAILHPGHSALLGLPDAFVFALIYGIATLLYGYVSSKAALELLTIRDMSAALADELLMHKAASSSDITEFEVPETRDRIRLAGVGGRALPLCFSGSVEVLQYIVTVIGLVTLLCYYHPLVAVMVVAPSIPLFYAQMEARAHTFGALVNNSPRYRRMGYLMGVILGAAYAKEVRAYGSGSFFVNKYQQTADEAFQATRGHRWKATVSAMIWGAVSAGGIGGAYLYIIYLTTMGKVTTGDVVMYSGAAFYAGASIRGLIQSVSFLWSRMQEADAFFSYLDFKTTAAAHTTPPTPVPFETVLTEWRVSNVSFSYPGCARKVLDAVSFRIKSRERIAIVGFNGVGKTTLMKLMLGLLQPDEGEINFRGIDLRQWDLPMFRELCGVVFQDFARFKLTLHENIALAVNGKSPADQNEAVLRAAELTGVDEIATRASNGYATHLGNEFVQGTELSGGQWQKVALARGFARDPEVIFLDEPNVSLDVKSEHAMFEQLLSVARHKTTIVISHRFAITPMVDRILVLEHGRLIEEGTHDQLMQLDGAYARMYKAQAGMYWPLAAAGKH